MDLKERIQSLCKRDGVSMNQLEQELEFGKGYISKLGRSTPNTAKIHQIAEYFGVSIDYLMTGEEREDTEHYYYNEDTRQAAQDIFENKELRMLFSAARDATPDDLNTVHTMLLALKRKERGDDDTGC